MKIVKKFLFMLFVVAGFALGVSAQKNDPKKPPKNPPKVEPGKPPRGNPPPRDDKKPKKPGMAYVLVVDGKMYEGD